MCKVSHFLPLSPDEVMLFKIFPNLHLLSFPMLICLIIIYFFLVGYARVQLPPPSTCFEQLEEQCGIVTPPYERFVVLESFSLKL